MASTGLFFSSSFQFLVSCVSSLFVLLCMYMYVYFHSQNSAFSRMKEFSVRMKEGREQIQVVEV